MLYDFTPFHRVFFVRTRSWRGLIELVHNREELAVGDHVLLGPHRGDCQRYKVVATRAGLDQVGFYCADLVRVEPDLWIAGKRISAHPSSRLTKRSYLPHQSPSRQRQDRTCHHNLSGVLLGLP